MANIPFLNTSISPLDESGVPTVHFRTWISDINRLIRIEGEGSPEGVIEARIGKMYTDQTGATGNVAYIKDLSDIAGDKSKGWILL